VRTLGYLLTASVSQIKQSGAGYLEKSIKFFPTARDRRSKDEAVNDETDAALAAIWANLERAPPD
jgi:hypothetical protein